MAPRPVDPGGASRRPGPDPGMPRLSRPAARSAPAPGARAARVGCRVRRAWRRRRRRPAKAMRRSTSGLMRFSGGICSASAISWVRGRTRFHRAKASGKRRSQLRGGGGPSGLACSGGYCLGPICSTRSSACTQLSSYCRAVRRLKPLTARSSARVGTWAGRVVAARAASSQIAAHHCQAQRGAHLVHAMGTAPPVGPGRQLVGAVFHQVGELLARPLQLAGRLQFGSQPVAQLHQQLHVQRGVVQPLVGQRPS